MVRLRSGIKPGRSFLVSFIFAQVHIIHQNRDEPLSVPKSRINVQAAGSTGKLKRDGITLTVGTPVCPSGVKV